ncbi:MAG: FAD binding domain-containing protein, partial [Rhodobiaceae bacterium]|nr:FAD binding domain-containing protein [Rhodobiaceae bacterium]
MIPSAFDYHRPATVDDAVALLAEHGEDARAIAGGHSLIPMMKLRMAEVGHLVDLQAIDALRGIAVDGSTVTIGAMTTQHDLIADAALSRAAPIIAEAALQIADPQVRYVGTIGGNVANGDPGNDMPGLMQCLDATYVLQGPGGTREVKARDFYESAYFTAREDDEILTHIRFAAPAGGYAYVKQKRKIGDYATAAAAVTVSMS